MKIILLLPSLDVGGAEKQAALIANTMATQGHQVSIVIFKGGGGLTDALNRERVELVLLAVKGPVSAVKALAKLMSLTANGSADVIYSFLPPANLVSGVIGLMRRKLRIVWGLRSSILPMHLYSWKLRALYWLEIKMMWMASGIITNSFAGQTKIPMRIKQRRRIVTVPNAIDTNSFFINNTIRQALRKKQNLEPETIAIGIVARMDPVKDHFTFVRAASRYAFEVENSIFFIIGDGDPVYRSAIETLVNELDLEGRFVFTGAISDTNAAYNMLDITALTSVSEGFPNAVGEAMATATPCAVTDVGDCRRLVGDPDLVYPAGDDEALASIWLRLSNTGYREAKGQQALKRVTETFTVRKCCDSTIDFLDSL